MVRNDSPSPIQCVAGRTLNWFRHEFIQDKSVWKSHLGQMGKANSAMETLWMGVGKGVTADPPQWKLEAELSWPTSSSYTLSTCPSKSWWSMNRLHPGSWTSWRWHSWGLWGQGGKNQLDWEPEGLNFSLLLPILNPTLGTCSNSIPQHKAWLRCCFKSVLSLMHLGLLLESALSEKLHSAHFTGQILDLGLWVGPAYLC